MYNGVDQHASATVGVYDKPAASFFSRRRSRCDDDLRELQAQNRREDPSEASRKRRGRRTIESAPRAAEVSESMFGPSHSLSHRRQFQDTQSKAPPSLDEPEPAPSSVESCSNMRDCLSACAHPLSHLVIKLPLIRQTNSESGDHGLGERRGPHCELSKCCPTRVVTRSAADPSRS